MTSRIKTPEMSPESKLLEFLVPLEKTTVNFKLDTGVQVTAITEEAFKLLNDTKLPNPSKRLHGPVYFTKSKGHSNIKESTPLKQLM